MSDLITQLSMLVGDAFAAIGLDATHGAVRRSDRPELADFQCNGAMAAAQKNKELAGTNPRVLAEQIVTALTNNILFAKIEVAGPGFINLTLTEAALSARLADGVALEQTTAPQTVLIDFAGPNMAKPMHVGHLRSTIIGDSLQRITATLGHRKISDAHFGDWGLQIGLLIIALQEEQPELPYFNEGYTGPADPDVDPPVTLADLERLYPLASNRMKEDEPWRDRARAATAAMQAGRRGYRALHHLFWRASKPALEREFASLGITFDLWLGESDVDPLLAPMIADLSARGIAGPDDGAVVIPVARDDDKETVPPFMLVSSTGAALYGTTDLATIRDRQARFEPNLYLYVVDQRQALHFKQLFRAAARAGYAREDQLEHLGFGTMNGTDGKPFKTRAGGVVKLQDLIETARDKALTRLRAAGLGADLNEDDLQKTALQIGTAALKFADLSSWRMTNYVFDFDRFIAFEGKTGPYLQYQGVRIRSILRKAAAAGHAAGVIAITEPAERTLALTLDAFSGAVQAAFEKRAPHIVAEHTYALAQAFSSFYAACPILPSEGAVRASRLALAQLTFTQLEQALGLLGIDIPERM